MAETGVMIKPHHADDRLAANGAGNGRYTFRTKTTAQLNRPTASAHQVFSS